MIIISEVTLAGPALSICQVTMRLLVELFSPDDCLRVVIFTYETLPILLSVIIQAQAGKFVAKKALLKECYAWNLYVENNYLRQ